MAWSRFERAVIRYAQKKANHNRFAELLREILPTYSDWGWGREGPYRRHFNAWQECGFNLTPNHYYSPIPDVKSIAPLLDRRSELVGLDVKLDDQLRFIRDICPRYREEYCFPDKAGDDPHRFHFGNGAFERVDAELLHCFVRHQRPRRLIEIGSGYSTLVAAAACDLNRGEGLPSCEMSAIEPNPRPFLEGSVPGLSELIKEPLSAVDPSLFGELARDDILFIDSTHVLKTGSDVALLFLDVIPRLQPGVTVHIHDVFLPAEYPRHWIEDEHVFWNEQYLLQAFLAFNREFSIAAAAGYLHCNHPDALRNAFPGYDPHRDTPGSFWFRRTS